MRRLVGRRADKRFFSEENDKDVKDRDQSPRQRPYREGRNRSLTFVEKKKCRRRRYREHQGSSFNYVVDGHRSIPLHFNPSSARINFLYADHRAERGDPPVPSVIRSLRPALRPVHPRTPQPALPPARRQDRRFLASPGSRREWMQAHPTVAQFPRGTAVYWIR